jgi:hypothetical protein
MAIAFCVILEKRADFRKIRAIALWEKEQLRYTQGMIRLL